MNASITAAVYAFAALALSACHSGGSGSTPPPAISNISGDYSGTLSDSANGTLNATGTLAQHGSSAGGTLSLSSTSFSQNAAVSVAIASSNTIAGSMVMDLASGATCTFSMSGSYDTSASTLSGSYAAVTGCSGESGTFALAQQCTDTITATQRRTQGVPKC